LLRADKAAGTISRFVTDRFQAKVTVRNLALHDAGKWPHGHFFVAFPIVGLYS
jgi:hypothetical protein